MPGRWVSDFKKVSESKAMADCTDFLTQLDQGN
jgi:hypothetical protein